MKIMNKWLGFTLTSFLIHSCLANTDLSTLTGLDIISNRKISLSADNKKGLVVLFLSAKCPCSNSHINEIKDLSLKFSEFSFVAVHSNSDEPPDLAKNYFQNVGLGFAVIEDPLQVIADQYKAFKTPHAFVALKNGSLAYQGGVSNSNNFEKSDRKFLREALSDLQEKRKVRTPEGRTLGCAISRSNNHVW
jgi:hypothetical protein